MTVDGGALRQVTPSGAISTIATSSFSTVDGPVGVGKLYWPTYVQRGVPGVTHVLDYHSIRRIASDGAISTLAGRPDQSGYVDGLGANVRFAWPESFAVESSGVVFVADTGNQVIRRVEPDGRVSTIAGSAGKYGTVDGTGGDARFSSPRRIVGDGAGAFYVAEWASIRRVTASGIVTTLAGGSYGTSDGRGVAASFRTSRTSQSGATAGSTYSTWGGCDW